MHENRLSKNLSEREFYLTRFDLTHWRASVNTKTRFCLVILVCGTNKVSSNFRAGQGTRQKISDCPGQTVQLAGMNDIAQCNLHYMIALNIV